MEVKWHLYEQYRYDVYHLPKDSSLLRENHSLFFLDVHLAIFILSNYEKIQKSRKISDKNEERQIAICLIFVH